MIERSRGDVVLVHFILSDESGIKLRPAVVISSIDYHRGRNEVIIAAISSQINRLLIGDHLINDWKKAGLLFPSVATGIIRTVKNDMIARKIGSMPVCEMRAINSNLKIVFDL